MPVKMVSTDRKQRPYAELYLEEATKEGNVVCPFFKGGIK